MKQKLSKRRLEMLHLEGGEQSTALKHVMLVPDVPGWAWDRRSLALQRYAPEGFKVHVLYEKDFSAKSFWWDDVSGGLHFSWNNSRYPVVHDNWWGFVANAALMYDFPVADPSDYWSRSAGRQKNEQRAKEILPNNYSGVITINPMTVGFLKSICKRVQYLRTGVDVETFRPTSKPRVDGPLRIGWCGKASVGKRFTAKGHDEVLVPLRRMLRGEGYEWRVLVPNREKKILDTEAMVDWYNSIDILLVTSSIEGTPSVALEAMACGRAVIGTPVGILPEIFSKQNDRHPCLWMTPAYRYAGEEESVVKSFVKTLERALNYRERIAEAGASARRMMINEYNWRTLAPEWLEVLTHDWLPESAADNVEGRRMAKHRRRGRV